MLCSIVAVLVGFIFRMAMIEGMNRLVLSVIGTIFSFGICLFICGFNGEERIAIRQVLIATRNKFFKR